MISGDDLFSNTNTENVPLADRMRPQSLKEFFGQEHLVGEGKILHEALGADKLFSAIFWGPPGSGKTTLAQIIANETNADFVKISAVVSNVSEMKKIIEAAKERSNLYSKKTILFIDEIHRFNKAQQDILLPHVEGGTVTLIGATTENPSFEVIGPLLSRSRVLTLQPLTDDQIKKIINLALKDAKRGLGKKKFKVEKDALNTLALAANGDARFALTTLEIAADISKSGVIKLVNIKEAMQRKVAAYDKKGDYHYDTISAFIKSMRAGKTDAAIHYLARMIDAGEDPIFIARRMVIFASEDIGNAQPTALVLATSTMQAVHMIGMPEAALILAQTVAYLSEAPKSISSTEAISAAISDVQKLGLDPIPLHLRNAPTKLMKELGYGRGHVRYPWRDDENAGGNEYMPKNLVGKKYYISPRSRSSDVTSRSAHSYKNLRKA
ncbi:MAG: replication-associated recombination protein A [Candidatus Curtissbacteria bacterium]|nr:replication-associated recombination protein A [Candidatus Curtissbacteria bacterium]